MTKYQSAFEQWLALREEETTQRAQQALDALVGRWPRLRTLALSRAGTEARRPPPGPRVVIHVDAVDTETALKSYALEHATTTANHLGVNSWPGNNTPAALQFIANNLPTITDQDTAREITTGAHRLAHRTAIVLGDHQPARPLRQAPCPHCETHALWWAPELALVRCGNPDCTAEWDLARHLPALHTTETPQKAPTP